MLRGCVALEIEARFSSAKGELLLIAWFEGDRVARLVVTGPRGEREEIQIKSIGASLDQDVKEVMRETSPPPKPGKGPVTARLQVTTEGSRMGRAVQLGNRRSKADHLCEKLLAMAELLSTDTAIKRSLTVLKNHL